METQWTKRRLAFLVAGAAIAVIAAFLYFHPRSIRPDSSIASGNLPTRLSNSEFWTMVTDFSEPGGYFHSDNYLSNEIGFQEIIPDLRQTVKPGGAYLGVGPEQNFTYIAALRPRMAFIIDIRRQNMIEQLLYKAFMEIASDRAGFISMLFARPRPSGLGSRTTADDLFRAFDQSNPNSHLFEKNLRMALDHLKERGITLSFGDQTSMRKVYNAFYEAGPDLTYTSYGNAQILGRGMPSYSDLMTATDESGRNWAYLASEEQFEAIRQLERNNLIVPLVGNFAGSKTIRHGRTIHKRSPRHCHLVLFVQRGTVSLPAKRRLEPLLYQRCDSADRSLQHFHSLHGRSARRISGTRADPLAFENAHVIHR